MRISRISVLGLLTFGIGIPLLGLVSLPVGASDFSWLRDARVEVSPYVETPRCNGTVEVVNYEKTNEVVLDTYGLACVYLGKDFQMATYTNKHQRYELAIKLNSDSHFRLVRGFQPEMDARLVPNSNTFMFKEFVGIYATTFTTVDVVAALTNYETTPAGEPLSYLLDTSKYTAWFDYIDQNNQQRNLRIQSYVASLNGRYAFILSNEVGHIKIDFSTEVTTLVSRFRPSDHSGLYSPAAAAVTKDGRYAFYNTAISVIDTDSCGIELSSMIIAKEVLERSTNVICSYRDDVYSPKIHEMVGYGGYGLNFDWLGDEEGLRFTLAPFPGSQDYEKGPRIVTLYRNEQAEQSKLDYLALGDSYSSGEGDLGEFQGKSFYTDATASEGGCHLSTRSYPFLLRQFKAIAADRMQSVACSGAQLNKDYFGSNANYVGQSRRLAGKSAADIEAIQSTATTSFTPGILKQIEFVKLNKPKVMTFTGSGNDVGFAKILEYCATFTIGDSKANTCDMALPNTKQRTVLGDAIRTQYGKVTSFIQAVKNASPQTTIYVVGYPTFVSASDNMCLNGGALNPNERTMINQGVNFMNAVLKNAARSAGAQYVDIENSLNGGRICEGSEYMTALLDVAARGFSRSKNQMFHPNHLGHEKMAQAINNQGFSLESTNPGPDGSIQAPGKPDYFGTSALVQTQQEKLLSSNPVVAGLSVEFQVESGLFAANSSVNFTMWSSSTTFSAIQTDSTGAINKKAYASQRINPGYHFLLAEGKSPSGNPVRYYQFVEVQSTVAADRDGDNINDNEDICIHISVWYDELTQKNVCNIATVNVTAESSLLGNIIDSSILMNLLPPRLTTSLN